MRSFLLATLIVASVASDQYCGNRCANNGQCNVSPNRTLVDPCSFCNPATHVCEPGLPCDAKCTVDTDCNQNGLCNLCVNGQCVSNGACGAFCDDASPCNGGLCTTCEANRCVAPCGGACSNRTVVPPRKGEHPRNFCCATCGLCLPDPLDGCGSEFCCRDSYCNAGCKNDTDCGLSCGRCNPTFNRCVKDGCGGLCAVDSDCAVTGGKCQTCFAGKCTSNCGGHCSSQADCGADCNTCLFQRCQPGDCGSKCLTNAGCRGPTCSFCNSTAGGVCQKGVACGAVCSADLDCDQTGTCTICPLEKGKDTGVCTAKTSH